MVELSQNWLVRAVGLKIALVDVLKRELLSAILIPLKEDDQSGQMQFSQISITKTWYLPTGWSGQRILVIGDSPNRGRPGISCVTESKVPMRTDIFQVSLFALSRAASRLAEVKGQNCKFLGCDHFGWAVFVFDCLRLLAYFYWSSVNCCNQFLSLFEIAWKRLVAWAVFVADLF